MSIRPADGAEFEAHVPVLVIGAGACGCTAALAVRDAGAEVLVLERDPVPSGSTAMSSGMIPACGTQLQRAAGVEDSVEIMAADIQNKARGEADQAIVEALCRTSGPTIDWLAKVKGIPLALVEGFLYPGHSRLRMHAPPSKTGADLIGSLNQAVQRAGVDVVTGARVVALYAENNGRVTGAALVRPGGAEETIGCGALVLACNGFGGDPDMVRRYIPTMAGATYFGHAGNTGDAVRWGQALGAATRHLGAFQGHGSLATPHNTLITWALMMEGGIQVNAEGRRFSNEHLGYSEQAAIVRAQPGGVAWNLYDARLHALGQTFEDYRAAEAAGAVRRGETIEELARICGLPADSLTATLAEALACAAEQAKDSHGRDFTARPSLQPPYYAVKVTGALFHTQGGLVVDAGARVLRPDGTALPNLFAGGGAACGVSGPADWGYLSGNGLLSAVMLGRIAGREAARRLVQ
jgi:fumarate reductase flavoprotein subunit